MKKRHTIPLPVLLLFFLGAGAGIWYMAAHKPYGEILRILPLEDGTALFLRAGETREGPAWLVKENPQQGIDWSVELPGPCFSDGVDPMLAAGGGAVVLQVRYHFLDSLVAYDLASGKVLWGGEKGEILAMPAEFELPEGIVVTTFEGDAYCSKDCFRGRDIKSGKVLWSRGLPEYKPPVNFRWGEYLVVGRALEGIRFFHIPTGDSLPELDCRSIFPMEEGLIYEVVKGEKVPATEVGDSVSVLMRKIFIFNPETGKRQLLQVYTGRDALALGLEGGGVYKGQVNWLLYDEGDTSFIESAVPSLTDQTLFMDIGRGKVNNLSTWTLSDPVRPAFNPFLGKQTRFVPVRIPIIRDSTWSGDSLVAVDSHGEFVMLDLQELEIAWRSNQDLKVYDYELLRVGDRYYLNGRGGMIALFEGDRKEMQRAIFVPGLPKLREYMFAAGKIWAPFKEGWIVLDAKNLRVVMKTQKDFEPSDVIDETRVKFGIP